MAPPPPPPPPRPGGSDDPDSTMDDSGGGDETFDTLPTADEEPELTLDDQAARQRAAEYLGEGGGGAEDITKLSMGKKKGGAVHRLGHYELHRELGRGAMGVVYEATDTQTGKKVAVKVLPPGLAQSKASQQRFVREAEAMAALRHPNILPVYGLGEHEGAYFYSMAIVSGKSLKDVIDAEGLTTKDAARFVRDSAAALDYAHDAGVIHRDIKPANLLIEPDDSGGTVLVADFGIAKSADHATLTASGTVMGTPMYMSPEQAKGETSALDGRSDVYSLGATLYECLTRAKPYSGEDVQTILRHVIETDPPLPRRINPDVPKPLEAIVGKAMEKRRDRRYHTGQELADDLDRYLKGQPVHARVRGPIARALRWAGRHKAAAALIVLITLATLGGGGTFGFLRWQHAKRVSDSLGQAYTALETGDLETARSQFEFVAQFDAGNRSAKAGLEQVEERRTAAAAAAARGKVKAALDAAGAALAEGDFNGARAKFELVEQLDPGNPAVASGIASIEARQREFAAQQARDDAARLTREADAAMKRGSNDPVQRAAELKEAEDKARLALEKDPTHEPARAVRVAVALARAHSEIARKQWTDARIYLALAREASGDDADVAATLDRLERLVAGTGTLAITTSPAGATAFLQRADPVTGLWGEREALGQTPVATRDLPMGSFRITLQLADHAPAHWPFTVSRNEDVAPSIPLVPQAEVPTGMVHVPAGRTIVGDAQLGTERVVELPAYLVDAREVTRESYSKFLMELVRTDREAAIAHLALQRDGRTTMWTPENLEQIRQQDGVDIPVVGIPGTSAAAYADWRGCRLPTADEWERAARGADGRVFPWGNRFDVNRVNCSESSDRPRLIPATAHDAGASPFGCLNMSGNVQEFTATVVRTVEVDGQPQARVQVRGGSAASTPREVFANAWIEFRRGRRAPDVGFRCVRDLPAKYGGSK